MKNYPDRITVGNRPYQTIYILQKNQLLLHFDKKLDDELIDKFLAEHKLQARPAGAFRRGVDALQAAKMRWVAVPESDKPLIETSSSLSKRSEVALVTPVYYAEGQGPESASSPMLDTIVIGFKDKINRATSNQLKELGLIYNDRMSQLLAPFHYFSVKLSKGDVEKGFDLIGRIAEMKEVENIEFDWLKLETYQQFIPNDTFWTNQWNMTRINLPNAWTVETGNANVWVAVIDSGFDLTHPDMVFTPNTGGNLTHFNAEQAIAGNPPPYNAGPSGVPHGTAVAGLAAATINNAAGVAGVAGGVSIMPVRLGTTPTAARVAAGINWAAANGARVASLSLTTTSTAAATAAVANAWTAGLVLCAATGNYGGNTTSPAIGFPANHANVIAVGATDQTDERKRPASADGECWGSQFGAELDVMAPGVLCWTTDEKGANGYNNNNGGAMNWACVNYASTGETTGNYFALFNGTSAATPHVSGLAALLFSHYPTLTNQQVRGIIERTCDKVNTGLYPYAHDLSRPNGTWHQQMGYGRINCNAALHYADIMIADHVLDDGAVPSCTLVAGIWMPMIFWGYQPYVTNTNQPAAQPSAHEPAKPGQDNYVHAVIRNLGPATAANIQITWHIMDYPGTALIWPTDWNTGNQIASATIPSLAPGASVAIQAVWPKALVNIASAYAHPCMAVQATCDQDVGGDLGDYVYEHNNIAQHNISFASFSSLAPWKERVFTLPFAIGHPRMRSRKATLLFDLRRANGARVVLDVNPELTLPYIDRIEEVVRKQAFKVSRCNVMFATDTEMIIDCCGSKAEILMKKGSMFKFPCGGALQKTDIGEMVLSNASRIELQGKRLLLLREPMASIEVPLLEGQIIPMAVTVEPPETTQKGAHFRVDITQVVEGTATGGLSLYIEAKG